MSFIYVLCIDTFALGIGGLKQCWRKINSFTRLKNIGTRVHSQGWKHSTLHPLARWKRNQDAPLKVAENADVKVGAQGWKCSQSPPTCLKRTSTKLLQARLWSPKRQVLAYCVRVCSGNDQLMQYTSIAENAHANHCQILYDEVLMCHV